MKQPRLTLLCLLLIVISIYTSAQTEPFTKRTVISGLNSAWEVLYGPNDSLWVTENKSYLISRINIATGAKTVLLDLRATDGTINFTAASPNQPQGGLMGLAIHPNLYSTDAAVRAAKPWVYAAYVYNKGSCPGTNTSCIYTTKIVRFTYSGNTLSSPVTMLSTIPGSSDHNSGRLVFSPVIEPGADAAHTQYRLYYTVGDMGAGQFLNTTRAENAQNVNIMEGKVLRLNSESDGDPGQDAWIPNDNPFFEASSITPQDYVYSLGHRNAQGLVWGNVAGTDFLYSTEQMDRTDDEINIIEAGKNYGWDQVSGYCDDNVNGFKIGQNTSANESAFCSATPTHREPIFTTFTETAANMPALMAQSNNALWPTIASSSVDFYGQNRIPGWNYSLLISPLKHDKVYRVRLNSAGTDVAGDTISYFRGDGNRVRRIRISPDGLKFYVARDAGATLNGGAIMEYTYAGVILSLDENPGSGPVRVADMISIYPNPVTDILQVHGKRELRKPLLAQVYDINGRKLREVSSFRNDFSVNVSGLMAGTYMLKLYNGNNMEVQVVKFIKAN
ncbi:MAG: PQQ-dependent sugar dehydrogenase [Sphingobacteriales bacterium]|nr:PQQ-dependent sugar dehydrogenase [Sphingobacteriales bacterium]